MYRMSYSDYYRPELSGNDRAALEFRVGLLGAARPRIVFPRRNSPQKLALADSATTTMIMAVAVLDKRLSDRILALMGAHADVVRGGYSEKQT